MIKSLQKTFVPIFLAYLPQLVLISLLFQVRLGVREWWRVLEQIHSCEYKFYFFIYLVVTKSSQDIVSHLALDNLDFGTVYMMLKKRIMDWI